MKTTQNKRNPEGLRPPQGACPPAGTDDLPVCAFCGQTATCFGAYEGHEKDQYACDDCCAHGNEDGYCRPVASCSQKTAQEGSVCEVEPLGEVEESPRGFRFITFRDAYDEVCSMQESSADGKFLWLGQDKVTPKILASKAATVGVITDETTGWVEVPVSPDVMLASRMHLHEEQVRSIVSHLTAWLLTGSFDLKGLPSSPPSSEDKELLKFLLTRGPCQHLSRESIRAAIAKESQQASTTPQKGRKES